MNRFQDGKAFIFDCDGTLLDTLGAWDDAERELFAQTGPLTQEQEDEIHSAPIERAAEIFHEKYGVGDSAQAVLAHIDGFLLEYYRNDARAMPGACELVRTLQKRGALCVVLSSSPRRYLDAGLKRIGIRDCFIDLVTTDEVGVSKQDHAIYERALEILGTTREETWAIDDAPYAVGVMAEFGLKTVGVAAGSSAIRRGQLEERADIVVETLCELIPS